MTAKTEPTMYKSLFGRDSGKKTRYIQPVSEILSGITTLIADLKSAAEAHQTKLVENQVAIDTLNRANDASNAEITAAMNAHTNLSALISAPV